MEAVKKDWRKAGLDARTVSALEFAEKLRRSPGEMTRGDVEGMRSAGFSDLEILNITLIVSLFSFMNRLTHALGLSGEEAHQSHRSAGGAA